MAESRPNNENLELSTEYYQEGTLEKDLWFQVATRDYTELLSSFNFHTFFSSYPSPIDLLDVGCGTGKFPSMLCAQLPENIQVHYDYLDPSQHCLDELKQSLKIPFLPRTALNTTLETLEQSACPPDGYQVIWCLQSLYCVQFDALRTIMKKLQALLNPSDGIGLIYLASSDAFYHRLYNLYNEAYFSAIRQPYITAQDVTKILEALNITYHVRKLSFSHTIEASEEKVLGNYLNQCVFDAQAWDKFQCNSTLKEFLESFRSEEEYRFPQQVWLIMFGATSKIP